MPSARTLRPWLVAAAVAIPALALAQGAKPLASVNGAPITEEDLKVAQDDIAATLPQGTEAQKRKYVLDYLVDLKILAQAAEKQKMGEGEAFQRKLAYVRDRVLMESMMSREAAGATDEAKLKTFYDEAIKGLPKEEEARARHILVPTEEEAKAVAAKLKAGGDFAALAKELSKDPGSGKEGGDLGFFTKERMVKEFSEAAFALKPGEISPPVKSQFGWHVIKLEEKREKAPPALADVKDELGRYLVQKAQQDMILKLRGESKVELADEFKPAPAPAAPAAPAPAAPPKP